VQSGGDEAEQRRGDNASDEAIDVAVDPVLLDRVEGADQDGDANEIAAAIAAVSDQ